MSRYLVLVLLNLPLAIAAILSATVDYKLGIYSRTKYFFQIGVWIVIISGLALAKPIYEYLFSNDLTQTEPLSLFDVIQITGIILVLFMANRQRLKIERLDKRVRDLHQELSIRLSQDEAASKK